MKQFRDVESLRQERKTLGSKSIGFVPTMGGLHPGHLSLVQASQSQNDVTLVSIYLNETQFNDPQDLRSYPANLEDDLKLLEEHGVDGVFLPSYKVMYPDDYQYRVTETQHSSELCGKDRPGHFDGVLTVVLKLLNLFRPTRAYFGEKDYQQLDLVRGMVGSFFLETEIVACPTKRDAEGLALSSRNRRLNGDALTKARHFAQSLKTAPTLEVLQKQLLAHEIEIDYLTERQQRRFAAVRIGDVRLIDNVEV
jgi:pantoate--beta-alanine ligase